MRKGIAIDWPNVALVTVTFFAFMQKPSNVMIITYEAFFVKLDRKQYRDYSLSE
jgi:hypothetical protein